MLAHGLDEVYISIAKGYRDLPDRLAESDCTARKGVLHSFVKRVEIDKSDFTVRYRISLPPDSGTGDRVSGKSDPRLKEY